MLAYVMSDGAFEAVHFEEPAIGIHKADYDYSNIYTYSDLEQTALEASVDGEVMVSDGASIYAGVTYIDFADDEIYVYGDRSGSLFDAQIGAKLTF